MRTNDRISFFLLIFISHIYGNDNMGSKNGIVMKNLRKKLIVLNYLFHSFGLFIFILVVTASHILCFNVFGCYILKMKGR